MAKGKKPLKRKATSKTTKKQVTAIAKSVVEREAKKKVELKFFDVQEHRSKTPRIVVGAHYSVLGFSSTNNDNAQGGVLQYPNGLDMYKLSGMNPFKGNSNPSYVRKYAIEGRYCNPLSMKIKWNINIDPKINPIGIDAISRDVAKNGPVLCRMIQVVPKKFAGSLGTEPNPAVDLFTNKYGTAVGVDTLETDQMDVMSCPVNTRRYKKERDIKFVVKPPWIANYVPTNTNDTGVTEYLAQIMPNNGTPEKRLTTYNQLAAKKGGKVYYEDPNLSTTINPTSGHQRTYTLFHFQYLAARTFTDSAGGYSPGAPDNLYIDCNPLSRFTDQ